MALVHLPGCPTDPARVETFVATRPLPVLEEPVTYWQRSADRRSKHLIRTTQAAPAAAQPEPTIVNVTRCTDCGAQEVIP